jgi:hypothetical protein
LFAAYPILFLWSLNLDEVPPGDALPPLIAVVLAATVATVLLAVLIGDRARAALIVTPIMLGLLMYGRFVALVDVPGIVHRIGWAGLVGLGALGAWRLSRPRLVSVDRAHCVHARHHRAERDRDGVGCSPTELRCRARAGHEDRRAQA